MNQLSICKVLLATCAIVTTIGNANAQGVTAAHLLNGGTSCVNVIRQIQIHGVNNSFNIAGTAMSAHRSPFGSYAVPNAEMGDLEIVSIGRLQIADAACGPKFNVSILNNSCRDVCNFHVTVVGTLGRIFPHSPSSTVCVEKICAGATAEVCVQLPIEALALGNHNGQVIGFQRLIVAVDSFDQLAEINEANNIRALACGEIAVIAPTVVETTTTEVPEVGGSIAPATNLAPTQTAPAATPTPPAPGNATTVEDPLRSAIRMLDTPAEAADTAQAVATN